MQSFLASPSRLGLQQWVGGLTLARRFLLAASVIILAGMAAIGLWVGDRIKSGVVQTTASSAALQMDTFVAPLVQGLSGQQALTPDAIALLDARLAPLLGNRVHSVKVWRTDGTVAYSSQHDQIGKRYPVSQSMKRAMTGEIVAELDGAPHEGDHADHPRGVNVLEVYAPVKDARTGTLIAVAEHYAIERGLDQQRRRATVTSWLVVGLVAALMMSALYGIVAAGSRTIEDQRQRLELQIGELQSLLDQNHDLRQRIQRAHRRSAGIHEQVLRRVGADLHDGPAQLLSFSLLFMHTLKPDNENEQASGDFTRVQSALVDSMREIRAICAGLTMPEVGEASVSDVIRLAVNSHSSRTRTATACTIELPEVEVPVALKVCIYRLVQEGLSNAFKHAGGRGQRVLATGTAERIEIQVSDQGPGLRAQESRPINSGLGLLGLRDRVETLGGELRTSSSPDGFVLSATFDVKSTWQLEVSDDR